MKESAQQAVRGIFTTIVLSPWFCKQQQINVLKHLPSLEVCDIKLQDSFADNNVLS